MFPHTEDVFGETGMMCMCVQRCDVVHGAAAMQAGVWREGRRAGVEQS